MYKSILELDDKQFEGTVTMQIVKEVQIEIFKLTGKNIPIPGIFKMISNFDMLAISAIVIKSICVYGDISEDEFVEFYNKKRSDDQILINFNNIFKYINDVLKRCVNSKSKNRSLGEDIFDDDPEDFDEWNFKILEYKWKTLLKRDENFWLVTPKNIFEQIEIYDDLHKTNNDDYEIV